MRRGPAQRLGTDRAIAVDHVADGRHPPLRHEPVKLGVDRRKILLIEPIKQLGDYTIQVRLEAEVEAGLKLSVTAEAE